ncbi:MAG: hypothetical protein CFE21_01980 [Bacteroidetes bacterium B1(2017)]|nr:MAG: hypothetical protein CFE21_01980 [Bacteroidetes bacterium B1(2017)]
MEIVLIILLIAIVIYQHTALNNKLDSIKYRAEEIEHLLNNIKLGSPQDHEKKPEAPMVQTEIKPEEPKILIVPETPEPIPPIKIESSLTTLQSYEVENFDEEDLIEELGEDMPEPEMEPLPLAAIEETDSNSWSDRFNQTNPDLERFIGENLISKIGIAILVLGIGFFVKYAIDQNWINEAARVGIGLLAGSIVMGFAHYLRKEFKAFSSVLVSGAIAVYYFTLAIGFQEYHLFSQTIAFGAMVVVTGFSVFISLAYDRQELSVLSLIGGFASPLMVSTGAGNYIVLFSYLLILDTGMLVLAYHRNWIWVNGISYLLSILIFATWLNREVWYGNEPAPYAGALIFASAFYVLFLLANLINQIKEKRPFKTLELSIVLSNTFLYFSCGILLLQKFHPELRGAFTIGLAAFNLLVTYVIHKNYKVDTNLFYLLIGLTLTFITLAAPIQLNGHYITLFWAAESCLLLWLAQRSKLEIYRFVSTGILILSSISLALDWQQLYSGTSSLTILVNAAFLSSIFVLASLVFYQALLRKEEESIHTFYSIEFDNQLVASYLTILLVPIGYLAGFLELQYHLGDYFELDSQILVVQMAYHFVFTGSLFYVLKQKENVWGEPMLFYGGIANLILFLSLEYSSVQNEFAWLVVNPTRSSVSFWMHLLSLVPFVFQMIWLYKISKQKSKQISAWMLGLFLSILCSAELMVLVKFFAIPSLISTNADAYLASGYFDYLSTTVIKSGFPILWGLLAFILLTIGIKHSHKDLRIVSLTLIGITIFKLFVFDIRNVSEGGKIAAFILLGLVLLVISFTYQKIKAIILEEKPKEDEQN